VNESPVAVTGVFDVAPAPSPSCPAFPLPQHLAIPNVVTAQECEFPASMDATPLVDPTTSTGTFEGVRVPSPSCPSALRPQHLTPPRFVRPQVWKPPAEIWVNFRGSSWHKNAV